MSSYAVVNPATGEQVEEYPEITDEELEAAIGKAWDAHQSWSQTTSVAERAAMVQKVADLHEERKEQLAEIIVREMGKPMEQAVGEVEFSAAIYGYYTERAEEFLADEPIDLLEGEGTALIRRSSMGPLIGIMPWNFPYYQVARFAGPNLIIGNTILLKPAPQCPESAAAIQDMYDEAGFPEGAFQTILATNDQIAEAIADPRVRGVSLTGSERAGAAVAEVAGRNLKKVVLELGGSDPFILLGAENLDEAVDAAVEARLDNTGQSCNAAKRFIVAEDVYDDFMAKFTREDGSRGGRRSGQRRRGDGAALVRDRRRAAAGAARSARSTRAPRWWSAAGSGTGTFSRPPCHRDHPGERCLPRGVLRTGCERLQGGSEEEAVELANDTPFGLGSYVFSTDPDQVERVANGLDTGMVFVNGTLLDGVELPFGGVKRSGFGRELGKYGMDEFVNKKLIRVLK